MKLFLKPLITFSILLSMILAGCEKVVYINLKDSDRKIVVSSLLCPDSSLVVSVSLTTLFAHLDDYWKDYDTVPVVFTDLNFYENDRLIGMLTHKKSTFYELPGFRPLPGNAYRIEASYGEMEPAWATVTVPDLIPLIDFDTTMVRDSSGTVAVRISFSFADPEDEVNFYAIKATGIQRYYEHFNENYEEFLYPYNYSPRLTPETEGGLFQNFVNVRETAYLDGKTLFTDELFNGKVFNHVFEIRKNANDHMEDRVLFRIDIQQIDKSSYLYALSERKYRNSKDNPFVEPVQVYSNVTHGFGLFSAFNGTSKEFRVDWTK